MRFAIMSVFICLCGSVCVESMDRTLSTNAQVGRNPGLSNHTVADCYRALGASTSNLDPKLVNANAIIGSYETCQVLGDRFQGLEDRLLSMINDIRSMINDIRSLNKKLDDLQKQVSKTQKRAEEAYDRADWAYFRT